MNYKKNIIKFGKRLKMLSTKEFDSDPGLIVYTTKNI